MNTDTTAPAFIDLKSAVNECGAPVFYTAEHGRKQHTQFCFLCPICGNTACTLDKDRSFIVESFDGTEVDVGIGSGKVINGHTDGLTPGVFIPMVCGNDGSHKFTLRMDAVGYNNTVMFDCHIEDDTYEKIYPELQKKWG